jgi:Ca-activated chloride channel family protein
MGDPVSAGEDKLDVDTLEAMARTTGGEMFLAINREELEGVYNRIDAMTTRQVETLSYRPVIDLYFWPLAVAIILVLLYHAVKLWRACSAANAADSVRYPRAGGAERASDQEVGAA